MHAYNFHLATFLFIIVLLYLANINVLIFFQVLVIVQYFS